MKKLFITTILILFALNIFAQDCPTVLNLYAVANVNNTATLHWENPSTENLPEGCNGNLYFQFVVDWTWVQNSHIDTLTQFTTDMLTEGEHEVGVIVQYYDDNDNIICSAEEVSTIVEIGACSSIKDLKVKITNRDATLKWVNPDESEYPQSCEGMLIYVFYLDNNYYATKYYFGYLEGEVPVTSFTYTNLSEGTHKLSMNVLYYNMVPQLICESPYSEIEATIGGSGIENKDNIEISPNPTNGIVNISGVNIDNVLIYNNKGQIISKSTKNIVNIENFSDGIYFIKVISKDGKVYNQKIIKN